jgi:Flp pilus assembly protein TadD
MAPPSAPTPFRAGDARIPEVSTMRIRLPLVPLVLAALVGVAAAGPLEDGKKALAAGKNAEAAQAFRKAVEASPSNREALLGLAKATFEGRLADLYEDVGGLLRDALKAKPDDRELRLALGHHYLAWMDVDDRYRADVQDQFGRLLEANPEDEDAVVGLARMYYAAAQPRQGLERIDAFLAKKPGSALALYWKGFLHYDDAEQAFKNGGSQWTPAVEDGFRKAHDAFAASTKADPTRYDAWLRLGYSSQYLSRVDPAKTAVAAAAYEKALDIDGDKDLAMKGLSALFSLDAAKWIDTLVRLAKDHPKAPSVHFYLGYYLKNQRGREAEAEKALRTYVATAKYPAVGWLELGTLLAGKGDDAGARTAFEKAIEADPRGTVGAKAGFELEKALLARVEGAQRDGAKAKQLVADWEALIAKAPDNLALAPTLHNNVAFFARDARKTANEKSLLAASVRHYEAASAMIPEWRADFEASYPYPLRHTYAQILNDTGLMYQYETEPKDFKKAEGFYRRAMDWSQHGYWDTYTNLVRILESESRWADAAEFASACAEGLKNPDGSANETNRATARADAARYEAKIPK